MVIMNYYCSLRSYAGDTQISNTNSMEEVREHSWNSHISLAASSFGKVGYKYCKLKARKMQVGHDYVGAQDQQREASDLKSPIAEG